jgi:3,2-trans-enoyl-CoA isomerase
MTNAPVNSINLEMMKSLKQSISEVESNPKAKAIVLTSACRVFSAGLDLTQMYGASQEYLENFWYDLLPAIYGLKDWQYVIFDFRYNFQEVWLALYGTRLATVASLNGHALAGGCILALACDLRVIGPSANIG